MGLGKAAALALGLGSLFLAEPVTAQETNPSDFLPKTRVEFADNHGDISSSLGLSLDKGVAEGDFTVGLKTGITEQNIGLDFLSKKDPVWHTITGDVNYGLEIVPSSFFKQELNVSAGYQSVMNNKISLYSAGQFFAGGEEAITLGVGNNARLEATGKVGGYLSLIHHEIIWDNFRAGYEISGRLPVSFLDFSAWFNQTYQQFNPDKYFFVGSSNKLVFGGSLGINLEELVAKVYLEKEIVSGAEVDAERIRAGGTAVLMDYGVSFRASAEFNQLDDDFWKVDVAGGKTVLRDSGYLEFSVGLTNAGPVFGVGFRLSPSGDGNSVIIRQNPRTYNPLIERQGYTRQGRTFEDMIKEIDTPTTAGNSGLYLPWKPGASPTRTPEEVAKHGGGDCDELAEVLATALKTKYIGYVPNGTNSGHAFTYYQHKDRNGRIRTYAIDNDHGAWFKINVSETASPPEIAKAAIAQLHNYFALNVRQAGYFFSVIDATGQPIYSENVTDFKSQDLGYAPIDSGLETRIGSSIFYSD